MSTQPEQSELEDIFHRQLHALPVYGGTRPDLIVIASLQSMLLEMLHRRRVPGITPLSESRIWGNDIQETHLSESHERCDLHHEYRRMYGLNDPSYTGEYFTEYSMGDLRELWGRFIYKWTLNREERDYFLDHCELPSFPKFPTNTRCDKIERMAVWMSRTCGVTLNQTAYRRQSLGSRSNDIGACQPRTTIVDHDYLLETANVDARFKKQISVIQQWLRETIANVQSISSLDLGSQWWPMEINVLFLEQFSDDEKTRTLNKLRGILADSIGGEAHELDCLEIVSSIAARHNRDLRVGSAVEVDSEAAPRKVKINVFFGLPAGA